MHSRFQLAFGPLILLGWLAWWLVRFVSLVVLGTTYYLGLALAAVAIGLVGLTEEPADHLAHDLFGDPASGIRDQASENENENENER